MNLEDLFSISRPYQILITLKPRPWICNPPGAEAPVKILLRFLAGTLLCFSSASFAYAQETSPSNDLGLKEGAMVQGADLALEKLAKDFPGDVEVLLSYPKSKTGTYFGEGNTNGLFGHIAIRIGNEVYTVNHLAVRGVETNIIHPSSLEEYLYTTKSYYKNEEFTAMQGQAYARDILGIRIDGISESDIKKMLIEVANIDNEWRAAQFDYVRKSCNCADLTLRILQAGGIVVEGKVFKHAIKMPLDVFDASLKAIENKPDLHSSLIHYGYVKSSRGEYKNVGFPLSLYQIKRAFITLFKQGRDKLEERVNAHLTVSKNSAQLNYERAAPSRLRCETVFLR